MNLQLAQQFKSVSVAYILGDDDDATPSLFCAVDCCRKAVAAYALMSKVGVRLQQVRQVTGPVSDENHVPPRKDLSKGTL